MQRLKHWETILVKQIEAAKKTPFQWGLHDCSLFACDVVLAMTGTDLAADFRGKYKSKVDAYRVMKTYADGGLEELVEKKAREFDLFEIPPAFAQRGDVVLIPQDDEHALGIVGTDPRFVVCAGLKGGLVSIPVGKVIRAWRI